MKPHNQLLLNATFGCTEKEALRGLAQRNRELILRNMEGDEWARDSFWDKQIRDDLIKRYGQKD